MRSVNDIRQAQGWTNDSLVELMLEFINRMGDNEELAYFLENKAEQENCMSED